MRILFSGVPAFGHLLPLAPLARAAKAAGHDVALLTSGAIAPAMSADFPGIQVLSAGPGADVLLAEAARRTGADASREPTPAVVAEFFAGTRIDLSADEALTQAREWGPDLIIAEATDFVGPLVAAACEIPWDLVAFGPAVPPEFTAPMHQLAGLRYESRNLTPTPPRYYLDPTPDALQTPGWTSPVPRLTLQPQPHSRPGVSWVAPNRSSQIPKRSRILITLGTVFADSTLVSDIVRALADLHVEMIVTTGVLPGQVVPADTANVAYVGFEPMDQLLRGVDLVVSAGGAGTVLAAHSQGIPMVLIPQGADQPLNAARAEAAGSALVVDTVENLADAVRTVLSVASFAAAARSAAQQIASMDSPAAVIEKIAAV